MSTLHQGDHALRAAGRGGELDLAPAATPSQRAHHSPDPLIVHSWRVGRAALPLLIAGFTIGPMRKIDVVVIGAGQAGLATSFYLTARGIGHTVLDRGGVADSWRTRRWDSFALNGPNWSLDLPGYSYDGSDPDAFMLRDEIVAQFQKYAQLINAPVEAPVEVLRVTRDTAANRFDVHTSAGQIQTKAVVAATGPYQRHKRAATGLDPSILQLNTDEFRNAQQLPPGGVLVVGSGQSGNQIAEDLIEHGRETWLATGSCTWIPRRLRGRDNVYWRGRLGMWDDTIETLGHALRLACPPIQTGVMGGRDSNLTITQSRGVTLTGRFLGADGHTVHFAPDLQQNASQSDSSALGLRQRVDAYIIEHELDAPEDPPIEPAGTFPDPPTELDLKVNNINMVIWATGFRLDFESWIDLDLNTRDGYPEQTWGVSRHPGLYFMGLQLMHKRKSGVIFGVDEDAAHITDHMVGYLAGLSAG